MSAPVSPSFASLVHEFFTDYMTRQRSLSQQTVASYRDSFILLLRFAERTLGKSAAAVQLADLDPKFIASKMSARAEVDQISKRATATLLDGLVIGTDEAVVTWPGRYADERGIEMWDTVMGILDRLELGGHQGP